MAWFFEFLTPFISMGSNFLNSKIFWMTFSVPHALIGGVQVLFGHQKQWSPPLALNA
jgi:hypothetical protein